VQRLREGVRPPYELAVEATGLGKRFGDRWVLEGLDLAVPAGSVLGLLGPNGAGKTTTVRMLTTLLRPDAGSARVAGFDVVGDADEVRRRIGLAGQSATVDGLLSGRQNLRLIGRLYRLGRAEAHRRADELLERFGLVEAADRMVKTYSGGMRRRLDLAASLVAEPPVLFLDEPTTGLDPRSRNDLWDLLRSLVAGGTTLVLTTQYLDEAEALCDRIAVIDHGRVIAEGTSAALKAEIGGHRLVVTLDGDDPAGAVAALSPLAAGEAVVDGREVSVPLANVTVLQAARALDAARVEAIDLTLREPTLDDVFLALTDQEAA
jgi:ABC-2 type transport system ATP-binding protein